MSYLLSAISGLLLILCFPPFDLGYLAWVALVPLFVVTPPLQSFFCGLIFFSVSAFWVSVFHPLAMPLAVIYLSLYFGLFGFIVGRATTGGRPYKLAAIWTGIEYIKSLGFFGFPWFSLGYTQYKFLSLIQVSQWTGVWGVTFLVVVFNASLAQCFIKKRLDRSFIFTTVIICAIILYGNAAKKSPQNCSQDELNIAVVQGNFDVHSYFPPDVVLSRMVPLSMQAVKQNKIDLVIWTETVILEDIERNEVLKSRLIQLVQNMNCYLLLGAPSYQMVGTEEKHFNSAVLISPDGMISYYNKGHLVPFGELVPGSRRFDVVKRFAEYIGSGMYDPDPSPRLFDVGRWKFGAMICFEGIFGNLARRFVKDGANFLVNITEDDWLKKYPSGMRQHAYMSIFRAVENKIYYIRAGNSGLSFIIDPDGRIIQSMPIKTEGFFTGKIYLNKDGAKTFYTKYGDVFAWMVLLGSIACVIFVL